jgi:outer membrane protein
LTIKGVQEALMNKAALMIIFLMLFPASALAGEQVRQLTLSEVIAYALAHNPAMGVSRADADAGEYGIDEAKARRMPRLNIEGDATRSRFDMPVTPISGSPFTGGFPEFDNTIYGTGITATLPLYRGGRLTRGVTAAELRKDISEERLTLNRQELIFNVTSVYYKIAQLERLLDANEASVRQLESHRRNAETALEAGTVARVQLLKTEVELAHATQNALVVSNSIKSSYELLRALMGMEGDEGELTILHESAINNAPPADNAVEIALAQRPDYKAALVSQKVAAKELEIVKGEKLPEVHLTGQYMERSGSNIEFEEDWKVALKVSFPVFDGGLTKARAGKASMEIEKAREEERALRIGINREVRDVYLRLGDAEKRIEVTEKAIGAARENLRVEELRFGTGAGTSTDVIDAQAALLRAEAEYHQAVFDRNTAIAAIRKALGEDIYSEVYK